MAEPAVKDAYQGLKSLIIAKYKANTKVQGAIEGIEEDASTWQKPLEASLGATDAKDDAEITAATERLQNILKETKAVIPPGVNINVDWKSGNISNSTIVTGVSGSNIVAGPSKSGASINAGKKDDNKK